MKAFAQRLKVVAKSRLPRAYDGLYPYFHKARRMYYRARMQRHDEIEFELHGPFVRFGQHAWRIHAFEVEWLADRAWPPYDSPLELFEGDRPLGPAHATVDELQTGGGGHYAHLGGSLFFTTSDGSDPNTNGRQYHCRVNVDRDMPPVDVRFLLRSWGWSAAFGAMLAGALVFPRGRGRGTER